MSWAAAACPSSCPWRTHHQGTRHRPLLGGPRGLHAPERADSRPSTERRRQSAGRAFLRSNGGQIRVEDARCRVVRGRLVHGRVARLIKGSDQFARMLAEVEPVDLDVTGRVARETEDLTTGNVCELEARGRVHATRDLARSQAHRHSLSVILRPLLMSLHSETAKQAAVLLGAGSLQHLDPAVHTGAHDEDGRNGFRGARFLDRHSSGGHHQRWRRPDRKTSSKGR